VINAVRRGCPDRGAGLGLGRFFEALISFVGQAHGASV